MLILIIFILTILTLYKMNRVVIDKSGLKLWNQNKYQLSQQLFDWYSFTHIPHGFVLYYIIKYIHSSLSKHNKFALCVLYESLWEILENTDLVINKYRKDTISYDYYGDSIVNSLMDIVMCMLGYWIAEQTTFMNGLIINIIFESFLAWKIKDNFIINVIMLLYPFDAILQWQRS